MEKGELAMNRSPCSLKSRSPFIADASVWINLTATGCLEAILSAIATPFVITDVALAESERGRCKGRIAADRLEQLIEKRLVSVVDGAGQDEELFLSLVGGAASETVDDGEAATIAHAERLGATAVIDDRKAILLAKRRFPELALCTTADLLLEGAVLEQLGPSGASDVFYNALVNARMRIPDHRLDAVIQLLGPERAACCTSLPAYIRIGAPTISTTLR